MGIQGRDYCVGGVCVVVEGVEEVERGGRVVGGWVSGRWVGWWMVMVVGGR